VNSQYSNGSYHAQLKMVEAGEGEEGGAGEGGEGDDGDGELRRRGTWSGGDWGGDGNSV
jgi:hypothetical protein